jgi:hypothetical protein
MEAHRKQQQTTTKQWPRVQILSPYHSKKLDRNADSHQRTTTNNHEHEVPLEATEGICRNIHKHCSSNLSIGTSEEAFLNIFRLRNESKYFKLVPT